MVQMKAICNSQWGDVRLIIISDSLSSVRGLILCPSPLAWPLSDTDLIWRHSQSSVTSPWEMGREPDRALSTDSLLNLSWDLRGGRGPDQTLTTDSFLTWVRTWDEDVDLTEPWQLNSSFLQLGLERRTSIWPILDNWHLPESQLGLVRKTNPVHWGSHSDRGPTFYRWQNLEGSRAKHCQAAR